MAHGIEDRSHRRAVSYGRQSRERDDKSAASPEAQRTKTLRAIEDRGWTFVDHYEDRGRSGWDPKVDRPGLAAALAELEAGRADALVVYRLDRLTRRGVVEAVRLVERIQAAGAVLVSATEPEFDLSTPVGSGFFAILSAMAAQESENISTRTRAAKAVLREVGSHMSGRPPFGHTAVMVARGGLTVRDLVAEPTEAPVVVELVRRVLGGESVNSLARELNARGITTRQGATWTTGKLGRLLRSPTLAGYVPEHRDGRSAPAPRDSRGRVMLARDGHGKPLRPWEPLVSPADWERLQDVLDTRPRSRGTSREPSLLGGAGLLRCAECGGPMVADRRPARPDGSDPSSYRCAWHRSGKTSATCPGVAVNMTSVEDFLVRAVFKHAGTLDPADSDDLAQLTKAADRFTASRSAGAALAAERAALEAAAESARASLERLDDDREAGAFDGALGTERYRRQVAQLTAHYEDARRALESLPEPTVDLGPLLDVVSALDDPEADPIGPGSPWAAWDLAERREFLGVFLERVDVRKGSAHGGNGRGPVFDPVQRLALHWR
ncbi:MAG TPA: recombinase family protein [Luteimicrobium sp.]|nr:recombinase family protein [Luteimicrobium sp.]